MASQRCNVYNLELGAYRNLKLVGASIIFCSLSTFDCLDILRPQLHNLFICVRIILDRPYIVASI
jgi:hypothetical protein